MLGMVKIRQNTMKGAYQFVPIQDFSEPWTDEKLYKKYSLTQEEIAFIESMIRPMKVEEGGNI
jgi:site-specific DNA-methyltransferase (adenine-specific)